MIKQPIRETAVADTAGLSYAGIKAQIAAMLAAPVDFDDQRNLLELGLSSLQIMRLVNIWRKMGATVTFAELISAPTLGKWWSLLQNRREPVLIHNKEQPDNIKFANMQAPFPLTDVQYAYWIGRRQDQYLGGVGCHGYLEVDGEGVDLSRLEAAWLQLLRHHPMLRVRFLPDGQQEVLAAPAAPQVIIHDLRTYSQTELEQELMRIRSHLSHRLFAIENGEVAGLQLSLLPAGKTRLHFDIDLLVADVQSFQIILRDLAAAYARGCQPQAPANWNFAEYLQRENERNKKAQDKAKEYWHNRLATMPTGPALPLKKNPEHVKRPVFNRRAYFVAPAVWELLKKRSAEYQVTPAMVLLTTYALVLERWSTTNRFLINIPLFDRQATDEGIEDVVADFTNLLLLEADCGTGESFLEQTQKLQNQFHQDMASTAYSGVKVQRDMARLNQGAKVFAPIVFSCNLGIPLINAEFREAFGDISYMISQTPQVWLDFQLFDMDGGLLLIWDGIDELFPAGLLDQMFAAYQQLIHWLAADNNNWQSSPDILAASLQQRQNQAVSLPVPPASRCLHTAFFEFAARNPPATALIDSAANICFSYGELATAALRVAAFLRQNGITEGESVAVTLPRGIEQIVAVCGILAIGACYVPVSIDQPLARRERIHKKAAIRCVLTDQERVQSGEWPSGATVLDIAGAASIPPLANPGEFSPACLAYVIFTSGSTGEPKGVEISHGGAWNTIADINRRYRVGPADRVLAVSALDFDLSVYDIFGLLSVGGSLVLITEETRREAAHWLKLLNKYEITLWNSVPVLLDMLLVAAESGQQRNLPLRLTLLSGDWIGLDLPARLQNVAGRCQLVAMGGATEASIWSNFFDVTLPLPSEWTSIPYGRPLTNQAYRVVDKQGRDCPDWVAGELWIGGAGVAQGYCGDPELTAARFVDWHGSRWYRTGDLGRYWPDGNIEFLGREDFQVKIRGHRIELGEIETVLKQHPGVSDAVVTAAGEPRGNKYLVAYVVPDLEKGSSLLAAEPADPGLTQALWTALAVPPRRLQYFKSENLLSFLSQKLPAYMVPAVCIPLQELPLTANGKLDRQALPAPEYRQKAHPERIFTAPRTPLEAALAGIWRRLLGTEAIDINDSFFELGGDSLLATRLSTMVRAELAAELSLGSIFAGPTIAELAKHIQALTAAPTAETGSPACLPQIVPAPEQWHLPFPLTDIQHAYWVGRSGVYALGNVAAHCYFELEAIDLDLDQVNSAWQRLIDHHGMMRAVALPDGQQKILAQVPPYHIKVLDLRGKSPEAVAAGLQNTREEMSHQVFAAGEWPLFDVRASRFGENRVRLHLSFDNLFFDGWSTFHLFSEWARLYQEQNSALTPLALSFRDYVLALEESKKSVLYKRDQEYWFTRLPDLPPAPELPLAQKPESLGQQRFRRLDTRLPREAWQQLKQRAAEVGLTPSGLLLAAYAEVLAVWSRRPRFTINLTQFNRLPLHPQVNELVGDFTSLTLLAVDHSSGRTFLERGRYLQQQLWQDLDHSYVSGIEVLRELAKQRGEHQGAMMPVVFTSVLGVDQWSEDGSGKKWLGKLVYNITQTPQVWLDHQVAEQDGELLLIWDAVAGLFPAGLLDDMFAAYCDLLQRLAAGEKAWHEVVPSLVAVPRLEARIEANNTAAPVSSATLPGLFARQAARQPGQPAVIAAGGTLTYEELSSRAAVVASILRAKGARPNTLVAVAMEKGWEQVVAVLGILQAGAAYLPLDPAHPAERRRQLLGDGASSLVLTQSWLDEQMDWPAGIERVFVDQLPVRDRESSPPLLAVQAEDLAYVIYTSGSTGMPKGVMIDHQGAVNTIVDINQRFAVGPADRVLALSNLNFDLSVYDIFGLLAAGGTIVMPAADKPRDPACWLAWMRQEQVTVWNTVPALLQMLLEYVDGRDERLPQSLRLVLLSGDWIPLDLPDKIRAQVPGVQVIGLGGATEASIWSNLYPIQAVDPGWRSIPYGRPLANQRYYVLNEYMENCPVWVPGELYIGGLGLAKGYWQDEARSKDKFIHHPRTGERLYRTGDWGRYWPDGNIEFLGREDLQVKIRGHRIELGEIEAALKQHPGVLDAVVAAMGEPRQLVGYVVPDREQGTSLLTTETADPEITTERWTALVEAGRRQAQAVLAEEIKYEDFPVFWEYMEHVSLCHICRALKKAGAFLIPGESYTLEALLQHCRIQPRYRELIKRWLEILAGEGLVTQDAAGSFSNPWTLPTEPQASRVYPAWEQQAAGLSRYLQQLGQYSTELLTGAIDPLELFFSEELSLSPDDLMQTLPGAKYRSSIVQKLLQTVAQRPEPLRVLEIGARCGSLTKSLLALLAPDKDTYTCTDLSTFFINAVKTSFNDYAFVEYRLLDIDKNPQDQGFDAYSYDVIIAADSLHRARNIGTALAHIQYLLAPGGLLFMLEATRNSHLLPISVGFLEDGFTHFEDERQAAGSPLLSPEKWQSLLQSKQFTEVAVFPEQREPASVLGQQVMAAQAPQNLKHFEPGILAGFLSVKLPAYMVPSAFILLQELPLTANGKLDRQALPAPEYGQKAQPEKPLTAPRTPLEAALAGIWRRLLGTESIDINDSFFELGGDSLLATRLSTMVRAELAVELSLGSIFAGPTIAELAEHIQALMEKPAAEAGSRLPQIVPAPEQWRLPFPLTDIQQAYWVGRSGVYALGNVATHCYFELEGLDLDLKRLNKTWQRLIDYHGMMRAVALPDGQHQQILAQVPLYHIRVLDLRGKSPEAVAAGLQNTREEMSHQVLATDEWPLFDVRASRFGENCVRLHISFDNLIFDGWSMFHLLREWTRLYHEPAGPLTLLNLSFRDYVLALEESKKSVLYKRDQEYWFTRLPDLPPAPELPLAQKPESLGQQRFRRLDTRLPREAWQQLKQRAAEVGLTPSGLLLAAYAEVLAVWSRRPRFTINLTQFNRLPLHLQVNELVGDFTSLTLLAVDHSSGRTFLERGRYLQQQLWQDLDHSYVSGIEVLRELAKQRGEHQGAVMPVVFTSALGVEQWNEDGSGKNWLGKLVYTITQTPQVWLDHQVVEQDGELLLIWDAVAGLFPAGLLDDMFAAYCDLLQRLAAGEKAWHEVVPSLVAAPRLEARIEANNTATPVSSATLPGLFARQAARQPGQPAVIAAGGTLTYEELSSRAAVVASILRAKGARPNTLVAVAMEKGWEQVVAVLGILQAGAAYLPLDPAHPAERRRQLLGDGASSLVLTQSWLDEQMDWPAGIERVFVDRLPVRDRESSPPLLAVQAEDLAYVIYTSGSTGMPKGVMIDHQGAVNTIVDINQRFAVGPADRVLALSNLNFDLSVYDIFGLLAAGGTIVMPAADKPRDPACWLAWMRQEQVTVWNTVPALLQMLLEYVDGRDERLPQSLRLVLLSGDWIPLDLPDKIRAQVPGVQVIGLGGATEASIWSNLYPIQAVDPGWRSIPYGRPLANQRYYVLNEYMENCPVWVPGELYIGGLGLAKGYWQDEARSKDKFIHHPRTGERLYRTGDWGRYWPDGNIEFLGREDLQVKIRGHRIELGEIEAALKQHPGVLDVIVAAVGEPPALAAAVVLREESRGDESNTGEALRSFLGKSLPGYMIPNQTIILATLPLSANGKVARDAVKQIIQQHQGAAIHASEPPRDGLERQIAAVWSDILGVPEPARDDDFFLCGGDSLKAVRLIGQLQKQQVSPTGMSLQTLFVAPTIAALAENIRTLQDSLSMEYEQQQQIFEEGII